MSWIPSSSWRADETSHPARVESPCPAGRERTPARSNTRCGQVFASLNVFGQALDGLNYLLTTYREYSKHRGASTAGAANLLQCRDALVSGQYGDLDHILVLPKYMLLELTILELVDAEVASVYSTLGLSATLYSKLDMIAEISGRTAESLGLIPTSFQVEAFMRLLREYGRRASDLSEFTERVANLVACLDGRRASQERSETLSEEVMVAASDDEVELQDAFDMLLDSMDVTEMEGSGPEPAVAAEDQAMKAEDAPAMAPTEISDYLRTILVHIRNVSVPDLAALEEVQAALRLFEEVETAPASTRNVEEAGASHVVVCNATLRGTLTVPMFAKARSVAVEWARQRQSVWAKLREVEKNLGIMDARRKAALSVHTRARENDEEHWATNPAARQRLVDEIQAAVGSGNLALLDSIILDTSAVRASGVSGRDLDEKLSELPSVESLGEEMTHLFVELAPLTPSPVCCGLLFAKVSREHLRQRAEGQARYQWGLGLCVGEPPSLARPATSGGCPPCSLSCPCRSPASTSAQSCATTIPSLNSCSSNG